MYIICTYIFYSKQEVQNNIYIYIHIYIYILDLTYSERVSAHFKTVSNKYPTVSNYISNTQKTHSFEHASTKFDLICQTCFTQFQNSFKQVSKCRKQFQTSVNTFRTVSTTVSTLFQAVSKPFQTRFSNVSATFQTCFT